VPIKSLNMIARLERALDYLFNLTNVSGFYFVVVVVVFFFPKYFLTKDAFKFLKFVFLFFEKKKKKKKKFYAITLTFV